MSRTSLGAGLEGKGVVVTGAVGGIGRATADLFARCGARVMAVDLDAEAVADMVARLPGDGHIEHACDLTDVSGHRALVERATHEFGSLVAMAHLAAVLLRRSTLTDVTEQDWHQQVDVNLKTTFFLCREVAEAMRGVGGSIVTFASQAWWTGGFGGATVYSASKGGVVSLTRGLARSYGPAGVRVNAVAPGHIESPMFATGLDPAVRDRLIADTPLHRIGDPHEIASVVVFLASDHASFVTGATMNVSGGFLMY